MAESEQVMAPAEQRRVALDAMGGDFAPGEVVLGAVQAAREYGVGVLLVGPRDAIGPELEKYHSPADGLDLEIVHTDEVIAMDEHPAEAIRAKKRNSITLCHELVRDGQALGAVSAGNSGAVMAAALFTLRRLKGVDRPAFAGIFPAAGGQRTVVLDIGANTDCKPQWLVQFALMGSVYANRVAGVDHPRVGLLANGEEESKGDQLTQETHRLLARVASAAYLNFVGNVEGRDVNAGTVDVVVCDGFVGNIVLKLSEGLGRLIADILRREMRADPLFDGRRRARHTGLQPPAQTARLRGVRWRTDPWRQRRLDHLTRQLEGQGHQERHPRRHPGSRCAAARHDRRRITAPRHCRDERCCRRHLAPLLSISRTCPADLV